MPQTDTTPTPADDTRSNAAKLLEQLLAILRGNAEGITDSFGVRILASAVARALDAYERCEMRPAPAAAGIAPMPDHLLPSELDALIRERFGGTPDGKPGAGRIRIQDWASRAVTSPPPAESDGALDPAIIDSANQLSFAVRLFQCAVGDAAVLAALTASLRAARPTAAAEGAIRGVEAILARGTPAEVCEARRRFLGAAAVEDRPELGSWVLHEVAARDLETEAFWRDMGSPDALDWAARAAMSLPYGHRQAIARGLRGALRRRLASYHRDEWSTAAAALLAIADPDRAFASSLHLGLKKRELTPADVESEFGADLYDAERHAICEAYTEPLHNQTLDTRGHSLLGRFAPTLPDSTELRVTCRGAGGTLVTIDLSVFDEPLDTEDGRLQCPYEAADILELLRVTGRLVTPPGGADEEHAVRRARQVARLRTAGTRIRTVPLAGRSN